MVTDKSIELETAAKFLFRIVPRGGKFAIGGAKKDNINLIEWVDTITERGVDKISEKIQSLQGKGAQNFFFTPFSFDRKRRIQANARSSRAFLCDLDVGPSKPYKSLEEAAEVLTSFSEETGLTPTEVVCSGNGIHAYWIVDRDIPAKDWGEYALRMHAVRKAWKIQEDETVPQDPAQYIRIPGTANNKGKSPKPVYEISRGPTYTIEDLLTRIGDLFATTDKGRQFLEAGDEFDRMRCKRDAQNLVSETSHTGDQDVHDCPENLVVLQRMLEAIPPILYNDLRINKGRVEIHNSGGSPSYELWRSVIFAALSTGLTGRVEAIYDWARPTGEVYSDWESAVEKVINSDGATGNNGVGVGTLIHFSRAFARVNGSYLPGEFEFIAKENVTPFTPKLFAKKESDPNALQVADLEDIEGPDDPGSELVEEPGDEAFAVLPKGFSRLDGKPGIFRKIVEKDDETGEWKEPEYVRVTDQDLYVVAVAESEGETFIAVKIFLQHRKPATRHFPMSILADSRSFNREMARAGVLPNDLNSRKESSLMSYIEAQARRVQSTIGTQTEYSSFGWCDRSKHFVKGTTVFSDRGPQHAATLPKDMEAHAGMLDAVGDLNEWKKAVHIFDRDDYHLCQMLIAMSMGAPLPGLYNAEHKGGFIYIWSTRGATGKSTIQRVMQGIWGKPYQSMLMGDVSTSHTTLNNQMGLLKDISLAIDEGITAVNALGMDQQRSKLAALIKESSQGQGKARSDQSGNLKSTTATWNAFTSISLNMSLENLLGGGYYGPVAQRVLEVPYSVPRFNMVNIDPGEVFNFGHAIKNNYGLAGDKLADYYARNYDSVKKKIHEEMMRLVSLGGGHDEHMRFYLSMFASAHVALDIATDLGLLEFNKNALKDFMDQYLLKALKQADVGTELDIPGVLSDFINIHMADTVTVKAERGRGTELVGDYPRDKVLIRHNEASGEMSIVASELRSFAGRHNLAWDDVLEYVESKTGCKRKQLLKRRDPFQGLSRQGRAQIKMICFDVNKVIMGDGE